MQVLHTELEQSMNVEQVIATKLGDYKEVSHRQLKSGLSTPA